MPITPTFPDLALSNKIHREQIEKMFETAKRTMHPTLHTLSQQRDAELLRKLQDQSDASTRANRKTNAGSN